MAMLFSSIIIIVTTFLFHKVKGIQQWPLQQISPQVSPSLEMCFVGGYRCKRQAQSILEIHIIECQPDEICSPMADTMFLGMCLG